jgi:hypothetical protein
MTLVAGHPSPPYAGRAILDPSCRQLGPPRFSHSLDCMQNFLCRTSKTQHTTQEVDDASFVHSQVRCDSYSLTLGTP